MIAAARRVLRFCVLGATLACATSVQAAPIVLVNDSSNNLIKIDTQTGATTLVGSLGTGDTFTDLAVSPSGELWGITFTSLYKINPNTGGTTLVGVHGVPGGNALVFGANGTLYMASNATSSLYTVNTSTGSATAMPGSLGTASTGDLAFQNDRLYLAGTSGSLVSVSLGATVSGTNVGPMGVANVFGLATDSLGRLIAAAGSTLYQVNTSSGALSPLFSYSGYGAAQGAALIPSEQTVPARAGAMFEDSTVAPAPGTRAVLITHGWNSNSSGWVGEMAQDACFRLGLPRGTSARPVIADGLTKMCQVNGWDVWVLDWRTKAATNTLLVPVNPMDAFVNAIGVGENLAFLLKAKNYSHLHLVAHSAGANVIEFATLWLRVWVGRESRPSLTIHESFLDPYDPSAARTLLGFGRHLSQLGAKATWADNYVDTRLVGVALTGLDFTDLRLANGFNFNVTPAKDGCEDNLTFSSVCSHSRPYRFYGLSIDSTYVGNAEFKSIDPISAPAGMGFVLSVESGVSMDTLKSGFPAGGECRAGEICYSLGAPSGVWAFLPGAIASTVVNAAVGTTNYVLGAGARLLETVRLGVGSFLASTASEWMYSEAKAGTTESPSWIVLTATISQPADTLRFSWKFASAGEGLLRVFVNDALVREIDQRFVSQASLATEEIYVGGSEGRLRAGSHRISFRLDGFGSSASGVELSGVELGNVSMSTAPGQLTASASLVDFGGQSLRTTAPAQPVVISNTGLSEVTINSVSVSPSFEATHNCAVVAVGASCTVQVRFTPTAEGTLAGTLTVTGSTGIQAVGLAGTGEKSLVTHYYRSILRRAPDAGGKAFWSNEAVRLGNLGANPNEVWYAMAMQFYTSAEYAAFNRDNAGFVTDLYNTFFNRAPDSGGLAFWIANLSSGMPREVALAEFMFSTEFRNLSISIFGNPGVRAEVNMVMDFYRGLLARTPDDAGLDFWVRRFRSAQCLGATAVINEVEAISSAFARSGEYLARGRTSPQYVGDLYNGFLRRGGDLAGVQFWVNQVASGARTRESVRIDFKNSPEFQARVQAVIQQGCLP